jgi:hypothetical protein
MFGSSLPQISWLVVSLSRFRSNDFKIFVTISTSHLVEIEGGVRLCHVCHVCHAPYDVCHTPYARYAGFNPIASNASPSKSVSP